MAGEAFAPPRVYMRAHSAEVTFMISHGSDWNDAFQIRDNGVPFDLTNTQLELVVRPEHASDILLARLHTLLSTIIINEPVLGKVQIYYPFFYVDLIPAGEWRYQFRMLNSGEAREISRGPLLVQPARYTP